MTTPDLTGLCERLRAKARASFEANKSFGRRGKEWAIETESEWQAAAAIERLVAENERMRKIAEGMSAAISWLDYPFIDNRTAEPELRARIGFMMKDAEPHRIDLEGASDGR